MNKTLTIGPLASIIYCGLALANPVSDIKNNNIFNILNEIQVLEGKSDPKCYATASRLEDFMYGTPLSDEARFYKNNWQKKLALSIWQWADKNKANDAVEIDPKLIDQAFQEYVEIIPHISGDWKLRFSSKPEENIVIQATDFRQYGSVAYSLRAILAVQQENKLSSLVLTPLSAEAINTFKQKMDLVTLAILQKADYKARMENRYTLEEEDIKLVSSGFVGVKQVEDQADKKQISSKSADLLKQIIQQKVASYKNYNNISNQIFVRNLQVYFARLTWPKGEEKAKALKDSFITTLTQFATELYLGSMQTAQKAQHKLIREEDVAHFAQQHMPHIINEYEDAIFFPNLAVDEQVVIEAYDMDSFRDSGLHWRYIEFALEDLKDQDLMDSDPFAAELLSENIAQYAVLLLRVAGNHGKSLNQEKLLAEHITKASENIKAWVDSNNSSEANNEKEQTLASSDLEANTKNYFTDVTKATGINSMHRSSDWLNRLLRSYLRKDSETGTITIPPAFGGSGIAAEDINNDGAIDLLILSGLGNKLYLNNGKSQFLDITQGTGLNWKRSEDNQPGEPRQPLIADIDNDGWQDIIITYVDDSHRVYKNLGTGKFQDMTNVSNLGGKNSVAGPATVFDYDNDGLLDIYVSYFGDYLKGVLPTLKRRNNNGIANKLFKNMGNFQFKDVTQSAGVGDTGWGQALTHSDLNLDGWQDLIVGNDFGVNVYYINQKDGTFINRADQLRTDKPSYTMNIAVSDLNRDLVPDIYISNIVTMNKDQKYVLPTEETTMEFNADKLSNMRVVEANDLFLSTIGQKGQLQFQHSDVVGRGYSSTGWSWDADFFDADMDGDDDLYVLNGMNEFNLYSSKNPYYSDPKNNKMENIHIPVSSKETNVFFLNHGGKLKNISAQSGLDLLGNSRSAAYFDFDNDGDLDIALNNYHGKAYVYQNNANRIKNNWIKVRPLGDPEQGVNRDAIGTKIVVTTAQGHQVWREVHGSTGYLSVHPKMQHFGVGKATHGTVTITWPNGKSQKIENVPVNHSYIIDLKNNRFTPYSNG